MSKQIVAPNKAPQQLEAGQKTVVKIAKGQHLRIQERLPERIQDASDVVVTKTGRDLNLKFLDGTEINFEGFYNECGGNACSVTVAGKDSGGYAINGDTAVGASTSSGGNLVYAYGEHGSLMAMAGSDAGISTAVSGLGEGLVAYTPANSLAGGMNLGMWAAAGGGLLAAAAGGGGGGGGAATGGGAGNMLHTVVASVVGGPVVSGNDLQATIYAANGTTVLGQGTISANGTVSIQVGSYTGVVIVKVVSLGANLDYMDEATGATKDLGSTVLYSMGEIVTQNQTTLLNVNVLTTLSYRLAAQADSDGILSSQEVSNTNTAIATAFGLTDLTGSTIDTVVDQAGNTQTSNTYGDVLAALSGVDQNNGGNTTTTVNNLLAGTTLTGSTATLNQTTLSTLISGANTADPNNATGLINTISNTTALTSASVSINSVATDNYINAAEQSVTITGTCAAGTIAINLQLGGNTRNATVNGTTWSYTLQGSDITACGQGSETLTATAVLNGSSAVATRGIFIDTTAPTAPTLSSTLTNDPTPVLTGTAEPGSTVTVVIGGATYTTTATGGGTWTVNAGSDTPTSGTYTPITSGSNPVTVTSADPAGNSTGTSASITLDITPPAAPTLALGAGVAGGANQTEATQAGGVITVSGESGASITVTFTNGSNTVTKTVTGTGSAQAVVLTSGDLATLGNGTISVSAVQTDLAGNAQSAPATTTSFVLDTTGPQVQNVAITSTAGSDNTYKTGDVITVSVTMNEATTVTGTPQVVLTIGSSTVNATYSSGSGSTTLVFSYTVQSGDSDSDGISIGSNALSLNGGTLKDAEGNDATLSFTSLADDASHRVDTTAPVISLLTPADGSTMGPSDNLVIRFDEAVKKGSGNIRLVNDTDSTTITIAISSTEVTVSGNTVTINPSASLTQAKNYHIEIDAGALTDLAGNAYAGISTSTAWNFTVPDPAISLDTIAGDNRINATENAAPIALTGTVSSTVGAAVLTSFNSGHITVTLVPTSGSTVTAVVDSYNTGTGAWTGHVAAGTLIDGISYTVNVGINNGSHSASTTGAVAVDLTAPAVSSIAIAAATGNQNNTLNVGDSLSLVVTLDEATLVTGTPQIALTVGSTTRYATYVSGSGTSQLIFSYTIQANDSDTNGISVAANALQLNGGTLTDISGNSASLTHGALSDNAAYQVDSSAPATPSIALATDSGSANNDGITNVGTVNVSGLEGGTTTWEYSTDSGTNWSTGSGSSFILPANATYASGAVQVRQTDAAGNTSSAGSNAAAITIDTSAPTAPTQALATDSGSAGNDGITNVGTVNVSGLEGGTTTWEYSTNGGSSWTTGSGTSFTLPANATYAIGSVRVRQTDAAGNTSTAGINAAAITVDTSAPTAPTLALATDSGSAGNDGITNVGTVNVSGLEGGTTTWEYSTNGGSSWTTGSGTSFTLPANATYAIGSVRVRQTDAAGNTSTAGINAAAITIDTSAPTAPTLALGTGVSTGASLAEGTQASGVVTVSGEAGTSIVVTFTNGSNTVTKTVTGTGSAQAVVLTSGDLTTLGNGTISVSAGQIDLAGNASGSNSSSFSLDTTAPTAPTLSSTLTNDPTPVLTGTAEPGSTVTVVIGGATYTTTATGGGTWSVDTGGDTPTSGTYTPITSGSNPVTITATDPAGNASTPNNANVSLDDTPPAAPTLLMGSGVTGDVNQTEATHAGGVVTVSGENGASITVTFTNGGVTITKTVTGTGSAQGVTLTANDIGALGNGTIQVSTSQTDPAGNTGASSNLSFVLDTSGPQIQSVAITSNAGSDNTYKAGDILTVSVTLNENTTVSTSGGTPRIALDIGGNTVYATYSSGSGSTTLVFSYTVQAGDSDGNGIAVIANSLSANGGTLTDAEGNYASLNHLGLPNNAQHRVDAVAPSIAALTPADGNFAAPSDNFVIRFDEAVQKGSGNIRLVNDTDHSTVTIAISSNEVTVSGDTVTLNPSADLGLAKNYHIEIDAGAITDLAGNAFAGISTSTDWNFTVPDPAISLNTIAGDNRINATENASQINLGGTVSSTTAGVVSGFVQGNITVTLTPSGGGSSITATVDSYNTSTGAWTGHIGANTLVDGTSYTVDVSISNGSVSAATSNNLSADLTGPSIIQIGISGDIGSQNSTLNAGDTIGIAVAMDDVTYVTGNPQIALRVGSSTVYATYVAGSGSQILVFAYTIQAGDTDSNGISITAGSLNLNSGTLTDIAGNDATLTHGALVDNNHYKVDTSTPATPTFALALDSGSASNDGVTSIGTVNVSGLEGSSTVWEYSTNGGSTWTTGSGSSFTLAAGSYSANAVRVRQTDPAGNTSSANNASAITVDASTPATPTFALATDSGSSNSDGITNVGTVNVSGLEGGTTMWEYSTDGGTNWTTGSGTSFTLADGSYSANAVLVRQTDLAGNVSNTGNNTAAITIDSSAPSAPVLALGNGVGNGANVAEGTQASGVVTVTGETGASIVVTFTNGSNTVTKTVTGTGSAQAVVLSSANLTTLGDGTISVSAVQTDAAGNASSAGTSSFALDTGIPSTPTFALAADTGSVNNDGITNNATVNVSGLEGGTTTWEYSTDGGLIWTIGSGSSFTLAEGSYATGKVRVRQTDAVGNVSGVASSTSAITIDTVSPATPALAFGTGVSNGASLGEATQAGGVFTVTGEAGASITVTFSRSGGGTVTKTLTGTGSAQAVVLTSGDVTTLGDGSISVSAVQSDVAGNSSGTDTSSFALMTTPPSAPTMTLTTDSGSSNSDGNTRYGTVNVGGLTGGSIAWEYSSDSGSTWTTGSGSSFTLAGNSTYAANAVQVRQVDSIGNTSTVASNANAITIDTIAPVAPTLALGTGVTGGATSAEAQQGSGVVTVNGENGTLITVVFNNGSHTVTKTLTGTGSAQAVVLTAGDLTTLADGNISVSAHAVDLAGNSGPSSSLAFTLETTAPTVRNLSITSSAGSDATYMVGETITLQLDATAAIVVSGTPRIALDIGGNTVYADYTSGSGSDALIFSYTVQAADLDANGISIGSNALSLNGGSLQSSAGNSLVLTHAALGDDPAHRIDTVAPSIAILTPADGSYMGPSDNLVIRFDEAVKIGGSGYIRIVDDSNGASTVSISFNSNEITISGDTVTINPTANLTLNKNYHIEIDAGVFTDLAGNAFAGISTSTDWNFTIPDPAISLNAIAGNNRINATENASQVNLGGTISSNTPALLSTFAAGDITVTLTPTGGGSAITATVDSYDTSTGAWTGHVTANTLADGTTYTANVSFSHGSYSASTTGNVAVDTTGPTVSSVAIYGATGLNNNFIMNGGGLGLTVTLDEAVVVDTLGGVPRIAVDVGGVTRYAVYVAGSGTNQLLFACSMRASTGDTDTDGVSMAANALQLNGGVIADLAGNNATITHSGFTDNPSYKVDTTAPVANFTSATDDVGNITGTLTTGARTDDNSLLLQGTCEAGSTVDVYDGTNLIGSALVTGTSWSYSATVNNGTTYQFKVYETDLAGNQSSATSYFTVTGDTVAPTPSTTTPRLATGQNAVVKSTETGTVYLVSINVPVGTLADITGANSTLWKSTTISTANTNTNLATSGLADGIYNLYAVDAAGNLSLASSDVIIGNSVLSLADVAAGSNGFAINGQGANDWSGVSVASAGDVNGDGLDDLIIGASQSDPAAGANAGRSYVVFGKSTGVSIDLSAVAAGSGGFVINGQCAGDQNGMMVASAGDLNGDGLADLIVGAEFSDPAGGSNAGRSYVVFGKSSTTAVNLSAVAAGSGGFVINGQCANDQSGWAVSSAGDVNGDGIADLIVGANGADPAGRSNAGSSYVIFGRTGMTSVDLSAIAAGSGGFVINGQCAGDANSLNYSTGVASAGDVNGDGLADLIVGQPESDPGAGAGAGRSYVIFGKTGTTAIELSAVAAGSGGGFVINGQAVGAGTHPDKSGWAVASGGDINGDGLADLLIAAAKADAPSRLDAGRSYVVFGKTGISAIDLSDIAGGNGGFVINGQVAGDQSGISLDYAGDINGDGLADIIIGSDLNNSANGRSYVVFGKTDGTVIELSDVAAGTGGFVINGAVPSASGRSVARGGDINGDGLDDLIVGAFAGDPGSPARADAGITYVIFGSTGGVFAQNTIDVMGTSGNDSLSDGGTAQTLVGGAGNDTLTATAASVLYGGTGDDVFVVNGNMITALQSALGSGGNTTQLATIDGGSGVDTLRLSGSGLSLDLTQIANIAASKNSGSSRLNSIEVIDLTGSGNNSLTLAANDIRDLTGLDRISSTSNGGFANGTYTLKAQEVRHQLVIDGNTGDSLTVNDGLWQQMGTLTKSGNTYTVYNDMNSAAQLIVDSDVTIASMPRYLPPGIYLSNIAGGTGGFVINGQSMLDGSGISVASAGDVNGDGLADLIVGAYASDPAAGVDAGRSYVVFGQTGTTAINLSAVAAGSGGFVINGQSTTDNSGSSVSSAGDINGDGLADLIVGAGFGDPAAGTDAGRSYVVFGKTSGTAINLSAVAAGSGGFVINGQCAYDNSGNVANAGDVNGDGFADLIIGASYNTPSSGVASAGASYVVFGKSSGTAIDLSAVAAGTGGFVIKGQCANDYSGSSVASAGDVNGDGLADLIVGVMHADPSTGVEAGKSYVVFGKTNSTAIDLSAVAAGGGGFAINGQASNDQSGVSVASAGDVNGDGLADLIVGAPYSDPAAGTDSGRSYVVFGKTTGTTINLSAVAAGNGGFVINGLASNDNSGMSVSSAGDINGDGLADLIVGAPSGTIVTGTGAGLSFVVYGKSSGTAIDLSAVAAGNGGFVIHGQASADFSGTSVAAAGDVNGDGLADLIVGASTSDPAAGSNAGRSYVIFGNTSGVFNPSAVDVMGTTGDDSLSDGGTAQTLIGDAGNDTLTATGASVLYGGAGNDSFVVNSTLITALQSALGSGGNTAQLARIDGGSGTDTLSLSGSGLTLNLTQVANQAASNGSGSSRLNSIEVIDITGSGNNTLTLAAVDVRDLTGINRINSGSTDGFANGTYSLQAQEARHQLVIDGNTGDSLNVSTGQWQNMGTLTKGGSTYKVYNDITSAAQLIVNDSVDIGTMLVYSPPPPVINLSAITGGTGGFVINGQASNDQSGFSVASAGDVNGDGLIDLIVGASYSTPGTASRAGRSYVVFGKTNNTAIDLSAVALGCGGFVITGQCANDYSGNSVAAAGDVNGDGLADLIIGARSSDPNASMDAGRSYVVYGKTSTSAVNLSAIASGSGGFVINGQQALENSGWRVASAGDVNGDGLADLIIGACQFKLGTLSLAGRSFVVFGKTGTTAIDLSAVAAGNGGFVINGQAASDYSGWSVASAGDVNGDGLADLIVGAPYSDPAAGTDSGRSYVVFGQTGTTAINLSAVAAGNGGFVINGQAAADYNGYSVASAGDVNGDGLADLIVGAYSSDPNGVSSAGRSYVVFGKTDSTAIDLSAVAAGNGGFVINGQCVGDSNGYSVASAGDINGDGLADLIVGATWANGNGSQSGRSYVVFGKSSTTAIDLSAVANASGGFVINGESASDLGGSSIAAAGDVNGDGLADLIVGAYRNDPAAGTDAGRSYVIFGNTNGVFAQTVVDIMGTTGNDSLSDSGAAKTLIGDAGNDTLTATGASILYGGAGNDSFVINGTLITALQSALGSGGNTAQLARIDGGTGTDTLTLSGSGLSLDLTQVANQSAGNTNGSSRLNSIEVIDLTGTGNNSLTLAANDISDLTGMNRINSSSRDGFANGTYSLQAQEARHQLVIDGNSGDSLSVSTGLWENVGTLTKGGNTYTVYNNRNGATQLIVDGDITIASMSVYFPGVELSNIAGGIGGFVINGQCIGDYSGWSVASAGDVNGDGLADLIVGAYLSDPAAGTNAGRSYVVFGKTGTTAIDLSAVAAGNGGFVINGQCGGDNSGVSVASAGDVNGDGLADLIVGANYSDPTAGTDAGCSYVVFGKSSGTAIDLSAVAAGTGGFVIKGQCANDSSGNSVASAGDVNGDGLADLIVGASQAGGYAGLSYVVFGKAGTTAIDLSAIAGGMGGFVINGQCATDQSGWSVSSAGDVNGDGMADLIVSAIFNASTAGNYSGRSYVVFGKSSSTAIDLSAIAGGTGGFVINGQCINDLSGISVASAGDVNGDGLADLIVGAHGGDPAAGSNAGRSYVVFGKTGTTAIDLSAIAGGTGGFVINGQASADNSGRSVASAGDVNGDGLADLIVGANYSDPTAGSDAGRSYVVFGKTGTTAIDLSAIVGGTGGFVINGQASGDYSGYSVSAAGDVNGDGLADLIVGAYWSDPAAGNNAGRSYVIFGSTSGAFSQTAVDQMGTTGADSLSDGGTAQTLVGDAGNDTLTATAASILYGGSGDDTFVINGAMVSALQAALGSGGNTTQLARIDGGTGVDTLQLSGAGLTFNLTQVANQAAGNTSGSSRLNSIEVIDLTGSGNNSLTLAAADIRDLTGMNRLNSGNTGGFANGTYSLLAQEARHQLVIDGDNGDSISVSTGLWQALGTLTKNGNTYTVYNDRNSAAQLIVDSDISIASMPVFVPPPVYLSDIASGTGGFVINGQCANDVNGYSVASAGDVNGDGLADLIVGAPQSDPAGRSNAGRSYVVFGKTSGTAIDLSAIAGGTGGFVINGQCANDLSGGSVAVAGDVNGDGLADLIVGAYNSSPASGSFAGRSYVVFGKTNSTAIDLSAIAGGTGGFVINGQCAADSSGWSVSSAGDVNGDGLSDLIVGAYASDPASGSNAGRTYVVYGQTGTTAINLSSIAGGTGGFVINGQASGDQSGRSVSSAGDVNGDGLADLIVGAPYNAPAAGTDAGRSYVVFGKTSTTAVNLAAIAGGTGGFVINGQCNRDYSGYSVSAAGDVNGDGLADLIVGAYLAEPTTALNGSGRSYVVFGKTSGTAINLSAVAAGSGGFVINGQASSDSSGYSVASAGDINGDGLADLIVGAYMSDPTAGTDAGRSYVVFGKTSGAAIDLSAVAAGSGGFVINGQALSDSSGFNVSAAGDVNGDGLADLIVGANKSDPAAGADAGRSYVIFGSTDGAFYQTAVDVMGTTGNDSLSDGGVAQTLVGDAGNDTLTATAASVLYGGSGADNFVINSAMITALQLALGSGGNTAQLARIDGGSGLDTITLSGTGLTLDLTQVANQAASNPDGGSRIDSVEIIDLTGTGNNTLKLTARDVLDMSSANLFATNGRQQLLVKGNAGDTIDLADGSGTTGWTQSGTVTYSGVTYNAWNHNTSLATVYVNQTTTVI